ncbi:hypothetical protein ACRRTK_017103 [Alexandromys fortis]
MTLPSLFKAFLGYETGMTHIFWEANRPGSKVNKKEVEEAVTIMEAPPMVVVDIVRYIKTPRGLCTFKTVFVEHISDECKRHFHKNWHKYKKKVFTKYCKKWQDDMDKKQLEKNFNSMKKYCQVIRIIAHTQICLLPLLQKKKAHLMEIQVNGGTVAENLDWTWEKLEQQVPVNQVFGQDEMIDVIGVIKDKGYKGVTSQRLPSLDKDQQKDLQDWSGLSYQVWKADQNNASTDYDLSDKSINQTSGFIHYGEVTNDFILPKVCVVETKKQVVTLHKSFLVQSKWQALEKIDLKFIDTTSKFEHGHFQTTEEKKTFMGQLNKDRIAKEEGA